MAIEPASRAILNTARLLRTPALPVSVCPSPEPLPTLMKLRMDKLDPRFTKSITASALPSRAKPYTAKLLPCLEYDRSDSAEPRWAKSNNAMPLPRRANP